VALLRPDPDGAQFLANTVASENPVPLVHVRVEGPEEKESG